MESPQQIAYNQCQGEYLDKVNAAIALLLGSVWYSVEKETFKVTTVGPLYQDTSDPAYLADDRGNTYWWPHLVPRRWNKYEIFFETEAEALEHAIRWHREEEAHLLGLAKGRAEVASALEKQLRVIFFSRTGLV